ncbi:HEC/Ndc80p family-domain-containing protein [Thamnocephalis sphaerospora]|uniref:Kinetochore protein NDC80 n=1 Tax=Thamnocephalis sphaerospora TaxID=78915 RepID=A0A4P9XSL5_9FUNG|nr:HEC/Ndc80p family-domain-containing protein [Thamnocephalis sphaerospora]|eukprot:RKP08982.1 HEC/Ndc80p family-domain-containing protein [Thamnocephalis sphaerospora]
MVGGPIKDPRPLRDKQFIQACVRHIIDYLTQAGYPQPVTHKTLQTPTSKDFQNIFRFLYSKFDPKYTFQKKFEEEVPVLLKSLRYPFCDQISKSQLYAVGSMHSWPNLLAMLMWMTNLGVERSDMGAMSNILQHDSPNYTEKLYFGFLSHAYGVFLAGSDDFDPMEQEMARNFDQRNMETIKEIERLQEENAAMLHELEELHEKNPPLVGLEKDNRILRSDRDKFNQYIKHLETKKQKLLEMNGKIAEEFQSKEDELVKLNAERDRLQHIVDNQKVSPADVDRMNAEQEQLAKAIGAANEKDEAISKTVWQREIDFQRKVDELEKAVQDYHSLAYQLALIPATAANANGKHLEVELNVHAPRVEQIASVDLRQSVKPFLGLLRAEKNAECHKGQDELIAQQETLDQLTEHHADKKGELEVLETRYQKLQLQYNEEREMVNHENITSSAEIDHLEQELQRLRVEGANGLLQAQQRAQRAIIDYDHLVRISNERKEAAGKEILRILEDLITFKTHVETSLGELEKLVIDDHAITAQASEQESAAAKTTAATAASIMTLAEEARDMGLSMDAL